MAKRNKDDDAIIGCLAFATMGLITMPFAGIKMILSKDPEKKLWGWLLLILGVILIVALGIAGS